MSTVQKYRVSSLCLVYMVGQCCTLTYVELSTCVLFALTCDIPVAEKVIFSETQSSTLLIHRVLNIPTPYLDDIIGYGVVH